MSRKNLFRLIISLLIVISLSSGLLYIKKKKQLLQSTKEQVNESIVSVNTKTVFFSEYENTISSIGYIKRDCIKYVPNNQFYQNRIKYIITPEIKEVTKGTLLLSFDCEFHKIKAERLRKDLELKQLNFSRCETLYNHGTLSAADFDKAKLELLHTESELKETEYIIAESEKKAPFDCYVQNNGYINGSFCDSSKEVLTIYKKNDLRIISKVFIKDLKDYQVDSLIDKRVNLFFNNLSTINGKIIYVAPGSDPNIGAVEVIILINEKDYNATIDSNLFNGELCHLSIHLGDVKNVIFLPAEALMGDESDHHVFIVRKNIAYRVYVTRLGFKDKNVIIQGLLPGQVVIVNGASRISNGDPVIVDNSEDK